MKKKLTVRKYFLLFIFVTFWSGNAQAQVPDNPAQYIRENYTKKSYQIPMRDGARLYTIVYSPVDKASSHPILLTRTPYGVHPYDEDKFRSSLGPSRNFLTEKYIFVYQDVRGRYMSEGVFENVRPIKPKSSRSVKGAIPDTDESTDTYDTIDWLIKNVPGHNGNVGL